MLVIPREPGTFAIPPLSIAVFDPDTKKFTTVASQPLHIAVTGAAGVVGSAPVVAAKVERDTGPSFRRSPQRWSGTHSDPILLSIVTAIVYSGTGLFYFCLAGANYVASLREFHSDSCWRVGCKRSEI